MRWLIAEVGERRLLQQLEPRDFGAFPLQQFADRGFDVFGRDRRERRQALGFQPGSIAWGVHCGRF
jgi:hypothetical protein